MAGMMEPRMEQRSKRELSVDVCYEVFGILTENSLKKLEELTDKQVLEKLKCLSGKQNVKVIEKMALKHIAEWRMLSAQGAGQKVKWTPRLTDTNFVDSSSGEHFVLKAGCCLKNVFQVPENIAQITGRKIMEYPAIVKSIKSYIYDKNLVDSNDRRFANCDTTLETLFHVKRVRINYLKRLVYPLLTTPVPGVCPCCTIPPSSEDELDSI